MWQTSSLYPPHTHTYNPRAMSSSILGLVSCVCNKFPSPSHSCRINYCMHENLHTRAESVTSVTITKDLHCKVDGGRQQETLVSYLVFEETKYWAFYQSH